MSTSIEINDDGDIFHMSGFLFHREDGPAIEWADGTKEWWVNGKRHREDGPAVILSNGINFWWNNDKLVQK